MIPLLYHTKENKGTTTDSYDQSFALELYHTKENKGTKTRQGGFRI